MMDPLALKVAARYKGKKVLDSGTVVYQYSEHQVARRNADKARRLEQLRSNIHNLRSQVKKDLKSKDPDKFLTALAVALIDHTYERVGNDESASDGHYGVTGWTKKHINFGKGKATIQYVGKSGVKQKKTVSDASLVKALKDAYEGCSDDNVFQHDTGRVDAGKVNSYLKQYKITAKDLRGFHANDVMKANLRAQRNGALPEDKKARQKQLKAEFKKALEETAKAVGHEASTLRSQYLVPGLEDAYVKDGSILEKMTKGAALKPPPKPIKALVEWVQEQVAGWVWAHTEMQAQVLRDAGPEWKDSLKKKEQLIKATKKYAQKPLGTDDPLLVHTLPLDLAGWSYPKPEGLPRSIGVILHLSSSGVPFGAASWMSNGDGKEPPPTSIATVGVMQVYANTSKLQDVSTPQDLSRAMDRLEAAVEHEGRHLAQDLLVWATGAEQAGLGPGARQRNEAVNPFENPEQYHLLPQEFHPLVDSLIRELRFKLKGVPVKRQRQKLQTLMDADPLLKTLEAKKPDWWRRAVKEITQQLLSDRVATRYAAEVLTKEWLMGVRRGWLSLLKPCITSWDDVMAAIEKLRSFVQNLQDQVFYIRRGPYSGNSKLNEGVKIKKILEGLDQELRDARSRASFGLDVAEGRSLPGGWTQEEADRSLRGWATDFEDAVSAGIQGSLTKMLDKALALLRKDAQVIRKHDEFWEGHGDKYEPPEEAYKEFSLGDMKVVIDDSTVTAQEIHKYIKYLIEARAKLKAKRLEKAWYGTAFVKCRDCGGENQYGAELGVGGRYHIGPDTVMIYSRPGRFIVELMAHELGHRYWFKSMSPAQRAQFTSLVKVEGTKDNPAENELTTEDVNDVVLLAKDGLRDIRAKLQDLQKAYDSEEPDRFGNYEGVSRAASSLITALQKFVGFGNSSPLFSLVLRRFEGPSLGHDKEHVRRGRYLEALIDQYSKSTYALGRFDFTGGSWKDFVTKKNEAEVRRSLDTMSDMVSEVEKDMTSFVRKLYKFVQDSPHVKPVSDYGGKDIAEAFAEVFMKYVLEQDMDRDQLESFRSVLSSERIVARFAAVSGWTEQKGTTGRSIWTRDDGKVQILDAKGRPGIQRYMVVYLKEGTRLEDLGWPSLKAAVDYVEGRKTLRDHPLHKRVSS